MAIRHKFELRGSSLLKLSSFMFWSWLYMWVAAALPGEKPEWYSRVVTLLHGSIAATVAVVQCDIRHITPARLTSPVTITQYALMVWSWGYFAMDFVWCLVYWSENLVMLLHHVGSIYAVDMYMRKENGGCTFACNLALMEITNPLLQTRWLLKNEGLEKTAYFLLVEVLYLTMFVFVRGIVGTYVAYKILSSDIFGYDEKIIAVLFFFVSWAFMYEIFGYVRYKYKKKNVKVADGSKSPATMDAQTQPPPTPPPLTSPAPAPDLTMPVFQSLHTIKLHSEQPQTSRY